MTSKRNQLIFFLAWTAFNLLYYSFIPFTYDIVDYNANEENSSMLLGCSTQDYNWQLIPYYMDLTLRNILPFVFMTIFSMLLIVSVFRARMRVSTTVRAMHQAREILTRDIRFSVMIVLMNFLFILLSLPVFIVAIFIPNYSNFTYILTYYIFFSSYAVNFYVMLITNTLFRNEVMSLIFSEKTRHFLRLSLQTTETRH